ncbi:MAG: acetyl-CoA carboxylase biotin carboxylase subunit [Gammaproteobacteria bacterium]
MFKKILIANRGEIARRVIRTAHQLGISTVAVYSEADRHALYVTEASQAICIGPPPATESYLSIEKIIDAAKRTGAEAIHPGYGFLSENADFAEACTNAGIIFVGPSADVIRKMGSKETAKAIMADNGVPVVPGTDDDSDDAKLKQAAESIGLPVLIKAVAGGGGRGMRLVTAIDDFDQALTSARREAAGAFGNDKVLLEKYIEQPRHLEVQIFGDQHGNVIHAFERDCSTQRRYQKVIEEAPADKLSAEQRAHLHDAAVKAGKAVGYVGAGTVEFVMDRAGNIYFIEMNTRLQVEHPVTEAITGEDLVHWQFIAVSGGQLPAQSSVTQSGHAIELRLCAEDPANGFAPSTGDITALDFPDEINGVRVDTGVAQGSAITPYYDSMFAKLIVKGSDRRDAIARTLAALDQVHLGGLNTNANFLRNILNHPRFVACDFDTHFVDEAQAELSAEADLAETEKLMTAIAIFEYENTSIDDGSPWSSETGFRLNLPCSREIEIFYRDESLTARVSTDLDRPQVRHVELDDQTTEVTVLECSDQMMNVDIDGFNHRAAVHHTPEELFFFGSARTLVLRKPSADHTGESEGGSGKLMAPMPGAILEVYVEAGQDVTTGTPLMLMEAMKIEHTISAPFDGTVTEVRFSPGDQVTAEGVQLIVMEAAS